MVPIEEESGVTKAAAARRSWKTTVKTSSSNTETLLAQLREALESRDNGRALYLLIRELGGDPLTEELAICEPGTDRALGFLVPAKERYSLLTVADLQAMEEDANSPFASSIAATGD